MDKKRILIVDDAATVRKYHRSILEKAGYEVDEAINGIEALEKILAVQPYDLYLVDINMPKMDGYTFLQELRKLAIPQGPAIMISTEDKEWDMEKAFQSGANYYIPKPVEPAQLLLYAELLLGRVQSHE
uniref:Response regulator n=1 Tax=Gracilinema caldarium TaxID=215591 RepID=A0A7C3IJH4_9SPIR